MRSGVAAFGLALGLLVGSVPSARAHPPSELSPAAEKATVEEVVRFRKALADAIAARDASLLRSYYSASFAHTHTTGKVDGRDARIVAALAGDPVIETAPVEGLAIHIPGGWTAVATGVSPLRSLSDGKTWSVRWMAVYVRTEAGWNLAASHATRIGESQSRP